MSPRAALILAALACTASCAEPSKPPPAAPTPAASMVASATATHRVAETPIAPGECGLERESLTKRRPVLRASPRCLALLAREPDLSFLERVELTSYESVARADVTPLARAGALTDLTLALSPLPSLEPLASSPSLRRVRILTPVKHLAALAPLARLESISVEPASESELSDVSALQKLPLLRSFSVKGMVDLDALARAAPQLTSLSAPHGKNLAALARFTKLEALGLGCFEGTTQKLSPPATLRELSVSCALEPTPLEPVAFLTALERLDISDADVRSLTPLSALVELRHLDAHGTAVADISPLAKCQALQWLDLHSTRVRSVAVIASLPRLGYLDLGDTLVSDVAPLAHSPALGSLWLPGTAVKDVAPLAAVRSLRELMVPASCDRADVLALHRARPDLRIMAWVEKSRSEDPTCF